MRRALALLVSMFTLSVMAVVPSSAAPPETAEFDDYIVLFPDLNINKSVFINITARDFCDWLATGPAGPPPAIDVVEGRGVTTGKGAIVGKIDQALYIEVWNFDEGAQLEGPCEDIQNQLDSGGEPWATGTADWSAKNNDVTETETRGNAFGDRTSAVLTDQNGDRYSYRNTFRLNSRCNATEFGPPSCLVDNSKLRKLK